MVLKMPQIFTTFIPTASIPQGYSFNKPVKFDSYMYMTYLTRIFLIQSNSTNEIDTKRETYKNTTTKAPSSVKKIYTNMYFACFS